MKKSETTVGWSNGDPSKSHLNDGGFYKTKNNNLIMYLNNFCLNFSCFFKKTNREFILKYDLPKFSWHNIFKYCPILNVINSECLVNEKLNELHTTKSGLQCLSAF